VRGQCHAPAAPYPRERPGTHCTGSWVGLRTGLDWCGESRPTGIRSPDRPARRQSLYRLRYRAQLSAMFSAYNSRGLCPRWPIFDPRSVHVRFVVSISLSVTFHQCPHTHLHLQVALTRRTKERSLTTFQKAMLFRNPGSIRYRSTFT